MSPEEQALADKEPTFADLCDRVRESRRAHLRAEAGLVAAMERMSALRKAEQDASDAAHIAMRDLDAFIARECAVEDGV